MASREQEKRRRREEREAAQRKEAAARRRAKRLQIGLASLIGIAVIAGIVVAITSSGGGDKGSPQAAVKQVPVPKTGPTELKAAAKAAGCTLIDPPNEGRSHVEQTVTYKSNPPVSGNHNQTPASDGAYAPGSEPPPEKVLHALEHSRIALQYAPGTPQNRISQFESVALEPFNGSEDYHTLVFQNPTKMKYAFAAVAWDHLMACASVKDEVFNAIRAFRRTYTDKGPEVVPGRE